VLKGLVVVVVVVVHLGGCSLLVLVVQTEGSPATQQRLVLEVASWEENDDVEPQTLEVRARPDTTRKARMASSSSHPAQENEKQKLVTIVTGA
jgi:hypothetical protein